MSECVCEYPATWMVEVDPRRMGGPPQRYACDEHLVIIVNYAVDDWGSRLLLRAIDKEGRIR